MKQRLGYWPSHLGLNDVTVELILRTFGEGRKEGATGHQVFQAKRNEWEERKKKEKWQGERSDLLKTNLILLILPWIQTHLAEQSWPASVSSHLGGLPIVVVMKDHFTIFKWLWKSLTNSLIMTSKTRQGRDHNSHVTDKHTAAQGGSEKYIYNY